MGLVTRVVEETGIPTINVSTGRDITALVRPPRSLFVNAPMGNTFGRPGDAEAQRAMLRDALELLVTAESPGVLVDHQRAWETPFEYFTGEVTPEAIAKQMKK